MILGTKHRSKVIGIVLARLDSSRLPGKALKEVQGKPLIYFCIERAMRIKGIDQVVLATTNRQIDDPLVAYVNQLGVNVFRGECDNVAKRCLDCANFYEADFFLRINGDSPFLDCNLVETGLNLLSTTYPDIITNLLVRTYPYGISIELINVSVYNKILPRLNRYDSEHVTSFFYNNKTEFKIENIVSGSLDFIKASMVVDNLADFVMFERVVEKLGKDVVQADYQEVAGIYLDCISDLRE